MARSMASLGMLAARAFSMASRSETLALGSPPPSRAATMIWRESLVKSRPRRASSLLFLCLMLAHLECPATRTTCLPAHSSTGGQRAGRPARRRPDGSFGPSGAGQLVGGPEKEEDQAEDGGQEHQRRHQARDDHQV